MPFNPCPRRRHYLGISAPPLILLKNPPLPGPGQYDVVNYGDPTKHFMSSAVFVSGTSRWTQDVRGQGVPGPGALLMTLLITLTVIVAMLYYIIFYYFYWYS